MERFLSWTRSSFEKFWSNNFTYWIKIVIKWMNCHVSIFFFHLFLVFFFLPFPFHCEISDNYIIQIFLKKSYFLHSINSRKLIADSSQIIASVVMGILFRKHRSQSPKCNATHKNPFLIFCVDLFRFLTLIKKMQHLASKQIKLWGYFNLVKWWVQANTWAALSLSFQFKAH